MCVLTSVYVFVGEFGCIFCFIPFRLAICRFTGHIRVCVCVCAKPVCGQVFFIFSHFHLNACETERVLRASLNLIEYLATTVDQAHSSRSMIFIFRFYFDHRIASLDAHMNAH